ncbi:MAG: phytanoyl-CoA dioxygenase family protein [Pseudomonadota bacterium]
MASLSTAERETYRQEGYLIPEYRLPADRLAGLQRALDEAIAANPGVRPEHLVSIHVQGKNAEGIVGSNAFLEIAQDPDILDLVEAAIGPDIILWGCHLFCKPAGDGLEVPWHQDGHYWPIRPLATCTVWIALEASDRENGCLRVIPGSHEPAVLKDHMREEGGALTQRLGHDDFDEAAAVDIELEPGQMSMHDVYMIHGSNRNTSERRRAGLAIRYMPATSLFDRDLFRRSDSSGFTVDCSTRPLWLVRGQDQTGRNDFTVGHAAA